MWIKVFVKALPYTADRLADKIPVYRFVCQTIFAFLTLNTPRSAHNKIFGAKFLSFERVKITNLYTACYVVSERSVMKSDL